MFLAADKRPNIVAALNRATVYLTVGTLFLILLQRLLVADVQIDWDEEVYYQIGRFWRRGLLPYTDIFDHKPPMVYAFYRLTSIGGQILWVRVTVTCLLLCSALQMFRALRYQRALSLEQSLFLAAALCSVISVSAGVGTNAELIYVPFELLSFGLLLDRRPYLAGISAAMAIAIKYTAVTDISGLGLAYWLLTPDAKDRTRTLIAWGTTALVLTILQYGAFYVYFLAHGVDLAEAIVYRNLKHSAPSGVGAFGSDSGFMLFALLVLKITAVGIVLCGFRVKEVALLRAVLPWLALSLAQGFMTRQYYYHYFLPAFIPVSIIWASFKTSRLSLFLLALCLTGFECTQVLDSYRWRESYARTVAQYRRLCEAINDRGYILTGFLAAYRVCKTPAVDKFLFPPFYLDEHFARLSLSGGIPALRFKLDNGEIISIISTPAEWQKIAPQLYNGKTKVHLVPDP